jgi:hypothetical protein
MTLPARSPAAKDAVPTATTSVSARIVSGPYPGASWSGSAAGSGQALIRLQSAQEGVKAGESLGALGGDDGEGLGDDTLSGERAATACHRFCLAMCQG